MDIFWAFWLGMVVGYGVAVLIILVSKRWAKEISDEIKLNMDKALKGIG